MGRVIVVGDDVKRMWVKNEQFFAINHEDAILQAPCEDIDAVIVDAYEPVDLSTHLIRRFAEHGTVLVVTDNKHMPSSISISMSANLQRGAVQRAQVELSKPRRKRIWQTLVVAKIENQALVLRHHGHSSARLDHLAKTVQSGDATNNEAQAARIYWQYLGTALDGGRSQRTRHGLNGALDYGYAVARALLARAVVATGLDPAMSVFHSSRVNPFALVDDLIEPFRPVVDSHALLLRPEDDLTKQDRAHLAGVVLRQVELAGKKGPLSTVVERYADAYRRCVVDQDQLLDTPRIVLDGRAE